MDKNPADDFVRLKRKTCQKFWNNFLVFTFDVSRSLRWGEDPFPWQHLIKNSDCLFRFFFFQEGFNENPSVSVSPPFYPFFSSYKQSFFSLTFFSLLLLLLLLLCPSVVDFFATYHWQTHHLSLSPPLFLLLSLFLTHTYTRTHTHTHRHAREGKNHKGNNKFWILMRLRKTDIPNFWWSIDEKKLSLMVMAAEKLSVLEMIFWRAMHSTTSDWWYPMLVSNDGIEWKNQTWLESHQTCVISFNIEPITFLDLLRTTCFPEAYACSDWLLNWSSAAKWAWLQITYLVAALSNSPKI